MDRGDYAAAYEYFDISVRKNNRDSYAWFCRATSARELGRLKEAGISLYKITRIEKIFGKIRCLCKR